MRIKTVRLVIIFVVVYFAICATLFFAQRKLLYFPQPRSLPDHATKIELKIDDGALVITTSEHSGERALIYFGGNGEDVNYNLPMLSSAFPDRAIYLMNYRGYGGSSGKPCETAIIADAFRLFDLVHSDHNNVLLIGRSLGSGVAVHVASERPVERMILVTPYNSIEELAASEFSFFPVSLILQDKYESWKYAPNVTTPTLLIQAGNDEVIPAESTMKLFKSFHNGVASIKVVDGAGHNNISQYPEYVQLLQSK